MVRRVTVVIVVVVFPAVTTSKWYDKETERGPRTRADTEQAVGPRLQAAAGPTLLVPAHRPLQVPCQVVRAKSSPTPELLAFVPKI